MHGRVGEEGKPIANRKRILAQENQVGPRGRERQSRRRGKAVSFRKGTAGLWEVSEEKKTKPCT